jgi:hypothetical protein
MAIKDNHLRLSTLGLTITSMTTTASITLRPAVAADRPALERLAALDSKRLPDGPLLLAESGDQLLALVAETDGSVAADPFERTADAVEMLREWRLRRMPERLRRRHLALSLPRFA